ncbi:MAG: two-component sensor histidine kinase [Chloroflexales bacterium]|nr:two-component sensor histidine kinase [Chloroflexales bacterium]
MALLALLATPISALGLSVPVGHLWALASLCGLNFLALIFIPVRRLPRWAQLIFLASQCLGAVIVQTLAPAPLLSYVYLSIVLQAIVLFPLWLWIPLAVVVYAVWSGLLAIATSNFLVWLQGNLALAFPATCAIIAAIVYARQQRRGEQAQLMLQQVQQRYDSLATGLRELQQRVMLEERRRLAQTIIGEMQSTLSRTEQSVAAAMAQAQTNLTRLQSTVAQTRASAALAVERMRGAVAALRRGELEEAGHPAAALVVTLSSGDEAVITSRSSMVLTWVLPSVFVPLAIGLTALQRDFVIDQLGPLLLWSALLLLAYVVTQIARNPLLLQAGLVGQAVVVVVMTVISNTLPLLLGLLLVLWQLSMRLPMRQIILYLAGIPAAATLLILRLSEVRLSFDALLVGVVAMVAVGGPLLLARRQLDRRKQAELRLALLSAEIEQQTSEVRALAVAAERSRLAREVHDDLGSRLMLITLQLQLAEELAGEDGGAALDQLACSREQLREAWRSVLAVADAELPLASGDLSPALSGLVDQCDGVGLALEGDLDGLPAPMAATIYRSVQEGLTNARKHAQATRVEVSVVALCGYVTVTVTNDAAPGALPGPPEGDRPSSFGLIGLRERAEALSGGIEVGPLPDGGWRLRVVLPAEGV